MNKSLFNSFFYHYFKVCCNRLDVLKKVRFSIICTLLFFMIVLVSTVAMAAETQRTPFTAEDMLDIITFVRGSGPVISPSIDLVAYTTVDISEERNTGARQPTGFLWVVPAAGGPPRLLLKEGVHGERPVWSPDGKKLAFFYEVEGGWRLGVWDTESDRIKSLGETFEIHNYLSLQWDAAGKRIVYSVPMKEKKPGKPPRVQVVRSSDKRIPGDWAFMNTRRAGLAAVDVSSGRVTRLVAEPIYLRSFRVSPDGRNLIYTAPTPETFAIFRGEKNETFVMSLSGGKVREVLSEKEAQRFFWSPDGKDLLYLKKGKLMAVSVEGEEPRVYIEGLKIAVSEPIWSPDGKRFVSLVRDGSLHDPEIEPPQQNMYTIARPFMDLYLILDGDGKAQNITSFFEDNVSDAVWSRDAKAVFFRATNNQSYDETIYRYTLKDQKLVALSQGEESYGNLSVGKGILVLTIQDATHPNDLWVVDTGNGAKRRPTELNPQLSKFRFSKPELFYYDNADGERLGALLYKPVGFKSGRKVPVITNVYEKLTPGIHRFSARRQIFLNHGYAMLLPNVKIKVGETATSFVECVVPAVNRARAMGFTNGRFGIWGGSFGGYATSYLITQTDIFACAVSRATPPELFREWASGRDRDSYLIVSGQARMAANPYEARERYISQSAFFHLDKVNTPVMIMHGVKDNIVLFGEGEMMFYALRQLDKEAIFVIYNHGDHSLSRHSRSDTLDVNRRMLEWFDKYLKK